MAKWILGASANREKTAGQSGYSLFTVQRRGLVDNASKSFAESPALPHGILMSGEKPNYGHNVHVGSIDTLISWFLNDDGYTSNYTFDLIIFDEAHAHHPKFAKFLAHHDIKREALGLVPAYVLGLTATPQAKGLGDVYKTIVLGPPTQWLIDNKFLAPFRYFHATDGQLDKLKKRGGEFTSESVSAAMEGMSGDLVRDWKKLGEGRPTLGFFPRRSHAQEAAAELSRAGLRVSYVDGETPDDQRIEIFASLNEHRIDYLCNVQVVERGTDIPAIACIQMCVSVASVTRWRQMIGRGSRMSPAKQDCIVIDHGGNLSSERNLGLFEDDPDWSLDITTQETGEAVTRPTIECPQCRAIYRGGRCNSCGYEPTPKERQGQGLEFNGAELVEFRKPTKEAKTKTPQELMTTILYQAGRSGRTWRQACGMFRGANEKQGTNHRVPRSIVVGGRTYNMIPYGSPDSSRRVSSLYPFTVGGGE
jgi:superfamily II DNA or RNA helicase